MEFISGVSLDSTEKTLEYIKNSEYVITNRPTSGLLWLNSLVYNTKIKNINKI